VIRCKARRKCSDARFAFKDDAAGARRFETPSEPSTEPIVEAPENEEIA
jgi:hypothetical protein